MGPIAADPCTGQPVGRAGTPGWTAPGGVATFAPNTGSRATRPGPCPREERQRGSDQAIEAATRRGEGTLQAVRVGGGGLREAGVLRRDRRRLRRARGDRGEDLL